MFGLIAQVLEFFYGLVPNYAIAIAMLTLAVMVILTPLTLKGTRSMMMMQIVQPELKKLQAQYKDDRQKLNEEMMKFYKENKINPLAGCLPLLVQMPVFLVLYRVLHGLTTVKDNVNVMVDGVERHIDHGFVPDYLDKGSELFKSLVGHTEMKALGIDLASSASNAVSKGIGHAIPYLILVVGVCLTSIVQQKQISGRNPAAQSNPQQQLLMKLGPIMITFFSLIVPAGLAVYFFVSNLYRVGQQELISRTIYRTPEAQKLREIQEKQHLDKQGKPEPKGFFGKLLGDMPQPPERRPKGSNGSGKATPAKPAAKNGAGPAGAAARPPAAASGRATPPGSRSAASRKKKKRK
jgi:YidC/Oxa1 family membrane protein insertase